MRTWQPGENYCFIKGTERLQQHLKQGIMKTINCVQRDSTIALNRMQVATEANGGHGGGGSHWRIWVDWKRGTLLRSGYISVESQSQAKSELQ